MLIVLFNATPPPGSRILLRIHVEHQDIEARRCRCGSHALGQHRLADAALVDRYCNCSHVHTFEVADVHNSKNPGPVNAGTPCDG